MDNNDVTNDIFGVSNDKYDELINIVGKRLVGKRRAESIKPFYEQLETEDRPLREKLILATMLGMVLR